MTKAANASIELIVGLGNPGREYEETRHNAGVWFIEELARACGATLQPEKKFHGLTARISLHGKDIRLLYPTTFMNKSGLAVAAIANFYRISPEQILVAHDELDIPVGTARLKQGGGHGGHNGLRDIISSLGNNKNFHRLRIGIDHPGNAKLVSGYVLSKPSIEDRRKINEAVDEATYVMPELLNGSMAKAIQQLHTFTAK
ncbi:aminoacyl-tRNA hydrolase [Parendozoicomonas haliclonae]|uniref:Peptidyl-tRNA hydrolase n=1 Tax=Parendozoicomonas haliclonae TaxID=1960125 RepID=A0A1X7ADP0_9GAMM|nr:aminoacyl-tRNA hydrolase [Parendozoicomonas haliclonae]SMA32263.1 Peptidyl-tRNA hydrolase [Parendozoicomonas haliclonae]